MTVIRRQELSDGLYYNFMDHFQDVKILILVPLFYSVQTSWSHTEESETLQRFLDLFHLHCEYDTNWFKIHIAL